ARSTHLGVVIGGLGTLADGSATVAIRNAPASPQTIAATVVANAHIRRPRSVLSRLRTACACTLASSVERSTRSSWSSTSKNRLDAGSRSRSMPAARMKSPANTEKLDEILRTGLRPYDQIAYPARIPMAAHASATAATHHRGFTRAPVLRDAHLPC